ncbi:MAG: FAD-dependent monooxygenase, partial [Pseudomonadota bacterium]
MRVLITGAGIGGLAAALYLHRAGIDVELFEQAGGIRELGVGINVLPHSVAELADLGLLDALDAVAIRTGTLVYQNRFGQTVWSEPRGLAAGYDVPQFSIHRGRFQRVLYEAAAERIGADRIHVGHRLTEFSDGDSAVIARFAGRDGTIIAEREGDVLVGADGIHSTVRAHHYPNEGPPSWNGMMMWRGATVADPIQGGRLMVIAGGMDAKAVIYPIADNEDGEGRQLINWVVNVTLSDGSSPPPNKEDWSRKGTWEDVAAHLDLFSLPDIDLAGLIKGADAFYEYPMCDRDPLPRWSYGRTTLLGD